METSTLIAIIAGLGLLGGIGAGIKALIDNKALGANATAVVTAAARELVDPLRKELAAERADHAEEIAVERRKIKELHSEVDSLRKELQAANADAQKLRLELAKAWTEIAEYRTRLHGLENGA